MKSLMLPLMVPAPKIVAVCLAATSVSAANLRSFARDYAGNRARLKIHQQLGGGSEDADRGVAVVRIALDVLAGGRAFIPRTAN